MQKKRLSERVHLLQPSPTLALDTAVKALQAQGHPIINFTAGEPDFDTPPVIRDAAIAAIRTGHTRYAPSAGIPALRQAIAEQFGHHTGALYDASQVIVGVGAKHLLSLAFQALCEPGDDIILPTPAWSTYVEQIKLAGATPVLVPLHAPFKLTASDVAHVLTPKTKLVVLCSPCNPTGAIIDDVELRAIATLAQQHNLFVISDEIYHAIFYSKKPLSFASLGPDAQERSLIVSGCSKTYAMTGWRIGYALGPKDVIDAMANLASQTTSGTATFVQHAALAALRQAQNAVKQMVSEFARRRSLLMEQMTTFPDMTLSVPEGAFYAFIDIRRLLGSTYLTATAWAETLLKQQRVAVVPGEAFFAPGYIRLSFASSQETLVEGLLRIQSFVNDNNTTTI